jgi:hypothetical protein
MVKALVGLAGAVLVVALFFVLRPSDDDEAAPTSPTTTTTAATTQTTPTTTTTTTRTTPPLSKPTTIRITVRGGRVLGGFRRATLEQGERAVLVVRADVADHVHLHGYDIMRDVAPGRPARLAFRATIPGRFEVELEDRRFQIAQLEVRP